MVRTTMRNILAALDLLHTEAKDIHTGRFPLYSTSPTKRLEVITNGIDLQPNNILLGIKDD